MKLKELIEKLKNFDEDLIIKARGCDCTNKVVGVRKSEFLGENYILLEINPDEND